MYNDFEDYNNNYGDYSYDSVDLLNGYAEEINRDIDEAINKDIDEAFNNAYDEAMLNANDDFEDQESDENQNYDFEDYDEDSDLDQNQNDNGNGGNGYDPFLVYTLKSVILRDVYSDRLTKLEDLEEDEVVPSENTKLKREELEHWNRRFRKVFELELRKQLGKKYPEVYSQDIVIWRPLDVHNQKVKMLSEWYNMMIDIIIDINTGNEKTGGDQKAQIDEVKLYLISAFKNELKDELIDNKMHEKKEEEEKEYQQLCDDTYEMINPKENTKYEN